MADFRKWLYALAMVALIVGLTVPANAQGGAVNCTASTVPTLIRAQAYADLVGDYKLICTGGINTPATGVVPSVNVQVFLSTNITSKLTNGSSSPFDEALLIIDEPNTATGPGGVGASIPILNCGQTGAPENTVSGPGVCQIISDGNPADTYNGTAGHPNIFQGRTANLGVAGISSSIVFQGVPFDPPGTLPYRTLRITNVRADAEILGVASSFVQQTVTMSVSFSGVSGLVINNLTAQQNVATILNGLTVTSDGKGDSVFNNLAFLQCNSENSKLFAGTASTGANTPQYTVQPGVQFLEGFASSWKAKNIATMLANGTVTVGGDTYGGTIAYPADLAQNVPGYNYFTESGFEWVGAAAGGTVQGVPAPNPPTSPSTIGAGGLPLYDASTGIQNSGIANQGTRLSLSFTNIPQGSSVFVNPVVLLTNGTRITGVMVLTATDASGNGSFTASTGATVAGASAPTCTASSCTLTPSGGPNVGTNSLVQVSGGLVVYEVLFADPNSTEAANVPVVVAYASSLSSNPPVGLPVPGTATQVAGGFAPFYTSAAARQPSATLPVPRFIPGATPLNLYEVVKCACDLLFPWTVSANGFDTGLAIANTSLDPGANFGFNATPQQGTVTLFYFGTGAGGQVAPSSQTSGVVPAGQVLTYVLSSGAGAIGSTGANGLDGRAGTGQFEGYIIAQAGFQYCHGFAFISPLGGGPLSSGVSEGYVALELDSLGGLHRTAQAAENLAH